MGNKLCTGEKFGSKIYSGKKLGGKVFTGKYIKGKHISSVKNKKLEHAIDIGDDPSFVCDLCEAKIHLGNSFKIKGCALFVCCSICSCWGLKRLHYFGDVYLTKKNVMQQN
ncbi:hypothetical protein ACFX2F_026924 [Malus domestica]